MKSSRNFQAVALVLFLAVSAVAQQPAQPAHPAQPRPRLDQYRARRIAVFPTISDSSPLPRSQRRPQAAAPSENRVVFSETPSPTSGTSTNISPASPTSIAASAARPHRKWWFASART